MLLLSIKDTLFSFARILRRLFRLVTFTAIPSRSLVGVSNDTPMDVCGDFLIDSEIISFTVLIVSILSLFVRSFVPQ